ncbi:hypothetical protein SARC_09151 [Sphaeroforma arctica JP610]|uniref:Uncharacterized protein n=1 Tax=Sphaeroforma arctica JP610 TaxID=667725 RepID=A0A0L0FNL9_9EUKA|nr:hypothetical protein SARC_09151 [Sphaeroforma arctica JP610]KNC78417.1 hypothetical protein SARC_09151 [Sphaeroforma arctica JP610]|eukprot:XP_014152319.1 hypothetical protein SARC_09151 [Sphaeroforma arctica JP610]
MGYYNTDEDFVLEREHHSTTLLIDDDDGYATPDQDRHPTYHHDSTPPRAPDTPYRPPFPEA